MEETKTVTAPNNASADSRGVPVLVTTKYRGVFFGWLDAFPDSTPGEVTLRGAQMVTFWSVEMHGIFGLASKGPDAHCRVGDPVTRQLVNEINSVTECTAEAVRQWEARPWNRN